MGPLEIVAHHHSLSVAQNDDMTILIGNKDAGAVMAQSTPSPYTAFTDETGALPTDGGCVKAEWVV